MIKIFLTKNGTGTSTDSVFSGNHLGIQYLHKFFSGNGLFFIQIFCQFVELLLIIFQKIHSYLLFFSKLVRTFSLLLDFYRIVHTFCFLVSHVLNKTYRLLIVDILGKNMDALVSSASFLFLSCIIKALQVSP